MAAAEDVSHIMLADRSLELQTHHNNIRVAIIGMPNSGKTSLFNALTSESAAVSDAAYATVRENSGVANYDDPRFHWLVDHYDPELCVPSRVRCVDLPPLVPGSWSGRGVGSELIVKHCAAADVLVVCVRAFEGQTVTHSLGGGGTVNPLRDLDLMMDELFDLDKANISAMYGGMKPVVEKNMGGSLMEAEFKSLERVKAWVDRAGKKQPLRHNLEWTDQDVAVIQKYRFLTAKPVVVAVNLEARDYTRPPEVRVSRSNPLGRVSEWAEAKHSGFGSPSKHEGLGKAQTGPGLVVGAFSGEFEERLLEVRRRSGEGGVRQYLAANPTHRPGNRGILTDVFRALGVVHFFTCGEEEVRSWILPRNGKAPEAAATIHRDFGVDFMSAEVMSLLDLMELGSDVAVKRAGKLTQQGRKYAVQDGDLCFFKFKLPSYKPYKA